MLHNQKPQATSFIQRGSSAQSIIKHPSSAGSNFEWTWTKLFKGTVSDIQSVKMGCNTIISSVRFVSILSTALGLILFIVSVWFLQTIEIHGKEFKELDPKFNYTKWEVERRIELIWGTGASIGISIGIFQFLFSLVFLLQSMREQQEDRIWNLAALLLHILFLFSILYTLAIAFHGLSKTEGTAGALHMTLIVCGAVETVFLVYYFIIFDREYEYLGTISKIFTFDEVKEKLGHYGLHKFKRSAPNIPMHRLVEESVSMPV